MCSPNPDLYLIKETFLKKTADLKRKIIICSGTGCVASGSEKVLKEFENQLKINSLEYLVDLKFEHKTDNKILVSESGCQGFCQMGPLVTIEPDGILYVKVKPDDVKNIVEQTILSNLIVEDLLYNNPSDNKKCKGHEEINFYKRQHRYVLKKCGTINPSDIDEYIAADGYSSAKKAILQMSPEEICSYITEAGLRGRGGGGFLTGKKWEFTRIEESDKKYVICNGDEGDPGAFMDRSIMEGNPHEVIEGMLIAGRAIQADEGFVYVRLEYPLAVKRIKNAVKEAEKRGLLGKNIFDSGFNFNINVMEGAGAFVCGEETALIESIQGRRGMPKPKPPFPSKSGLWEKPTVINNVETLATVPLIIRDGYKNFRNYGTKNSPGTKTFALTGHVANTGLIEVPFGTTLREIIYNIGGGITNNDGSINKNGFKAVQIGGPSGGCLTEEHLDMPLDFDSLSGIGAMIGSGGLVAMNKDTCMVQMARFFMQFTQNESCGKCVLCREGTKQMLALLDKIIDGRAVEDDLKLLEDLAGAVKTASLCGLGKSAPNPVLSMMNYFRDEYYTHVVDKKCPTKQCKSLLTPQIDALLCKGCGVCVKKCPVNAISGVRKEPFVINELLCIKCGACIDACKLNAVVGG
ncbi:MAG: NADH-quinone oxidoreductase subunit F [Ignavibacteriae bacterium HGW-Ignavibacteriae-2]|jgi:NADH-quinone oxidoreductase subunit F|nr:MAG: NADH-quinone oxidoreductase subunit F [Ignavibacteriae bacterium HGW-Ignavibacteriae-2]